MNLHTLFSFVRNRELWLLFSISREMQRCYRLAFLAGGLSSGWLKKLAAGPIPFGRLAAELIPGSADLDGLRAWLRLGLTLGELRSNPEGYSLRGRLSRKLTDPAHDAAAACIEEAATIDNFLITNTPDRLRQGRRFTLADQDARLVARSSRIVEPFIREALDAIIPLRGPVRLFEIGCGAAAYMRYAASRNPELTALGMELQAAAAALAVENIARWNLTGRVSIEVGDVLQRNPQPLFDIATLHQNIYYFPVQNRLDVLRHVRGFLKPGGRLLLTTFCQSQGLASGLLDLWSAMTEGCGRLPTLQEMKAQLVEAGFVNVANRSLIPGESFHSFLGTASEAA